MDTEERLAKLERELFAEKRRNRWLLAVLVIGIVGILAWTLATSAPTAQAQGANNGPKEIRAKEFIAEDEKGKPRAGLGANKDGSGLTLYDKNGKLRVMLNVSKDGPSLALFDENGEPRAALRVVKNGPVLLMYDETGKGRGMLGVGKEAGPGLFLYDANGKVIRSLP